MLADDDYWDYWFDGIIGTCRLIADRDVFKRVWILGDFTITSIHYYDELLEQLLGDLHLDTSLQRFEKRLSDVGALEAVQEFARALHELDACVSGAPELQDARTLLDSREWRDFQLTAKRVTDLPIARPQ
jgi:hypothetical protein